MQHGPASKANGHIPLNLSLLVSKKPSPHLLGIGIGSTLSPFPPMLLSLMKRLRRGEKQSGLSGHRWQAPWVRALPWSRGLTARGQRLCNYLISRRKRHKSNSSCTSTYKSIFTILLGTELICQLIQAWQVLIMRLTQTCPWVFCTCHDCDSLTAVTRRHNLASPEQTNGITSMMHTFLGIIMILY